MSDKVGLCLKGMGKLSFKEKSFSGSWKLLFTTLQTLTLFQGKIPRRVTMLASSPTLEPLHLHQETHTLPEIPHSLLQCIFPEERHDDAYSLSLILPTLFEYI